MEIKIKEEQIRNNRLARPECRVRIYPRFEAAGGAWRSLGAGGGGEEPGQRDEGEKSCRWTSPGQAGIDAIFERGRYNFLPADWRRRAIGGERKRGEEGEEWTRREHG